MKEDSLFRYAVLVALGALLLTVGIFVPGDSARTVSGLCIGLGAGLVGMNVANFIIDRYYKKHPDLKRQSEIEARDERSIFIANKAKARAFDIMIKVMILIPFLLILADSPLWMTLAAVLLYLFGFGLRVYYTIKYSKEM